MSFHHVPVLFHETIEGLCLRPDGIYVDCTVGGGGHSRAICEQLKTGRLIAIDQDEEALAAARVNLAPWADRIHFHHANFEDLASVLREEGTPLVDGILMDIGVSSHQLDVGERGFSYHQEAPLDMRMDRRQEKTAADLVNRCSAEELAHLFRVYGEERWAVRIANFIVEARQEAPLQTTGQLVEVIRHAVPKGARRGEKHPGRRVFQALRIAVNRELDVLQEAMSVAVQHLRPGGRLCIITFHSLEDRMVKEFYKEQAQGCICPPDFPVCVCHRKPVIRIVTKKPIVAGEEELEKNPRARSAKLRIAEKIDGSEPSEQKGNG